MSTPADQGTAGPGPPDAPARSVGAMAFGDHCCLAYDSDAERYAVLATYIRDGLAADHKIIYLADEPAPEPVLARLVAAVTGSGVPGTAGLDLRDAAASGRLAIRPFADAFMATGRFDPGETVALLGGEVDLALLQGHAGVRISGETSFSLRGWPGSEQFAEFEHRCGQAFRTPGGRAMMICQYDRRWFGAAQLRDLEGCHDGPVRVDDLYDDGVLRVTPTFTPPGLRLTGAIDESTLPAVRGALARPAASAGHFCLDLSELEFCDMEGLRMLVGTGQTSTGIDRQVILRGVPGFLDLMMRIAGWDTVPGVYLEGAPR